MLEALHLLLEELEDDRPPVDRRVGDGDGFVVAVQQRSASDRQRAARGQDVDEDFCADQILSRGSRTACQADGLDRGILRNIAAPSTQERLAQSVVLSAEVTHPAIAFRANVAAVLGGRKFGRYPDIAAAEVMQQSLVHEMRPPTARANLAHVKMMAVAFGAETDAIEEAFFEIIVPSEDAQVPLDVIAARNVCIAVLGERRSDRVYFPSSLRDLSQKVESALFRGDAGARIDFR